METEQVEDWSGRGKVIRIWSLCDQANELEKDDVRTEFAPVAEAVAEWNAMQIVERPLMSIPANANAVVR